MLRQVWQQQLEAWRELLAQTTERASRKRVHALRSLTLRLQVTPENCVADPTQDPISERAFKRWRKEGKRLSRALGPVRDADVFLARLDKMRQASGTAAGGESQMSSRCLCEIEELENMFKKRRKAGISKLMAVADVRGKRLNRLSKELEASVAPRIPVRVKTTTGMALRIFGEVSRDIPKLDGENLHEFRKRLKPVLYLAEISAATDPLAKRLAAGSRKMHNATGEWHDLQALTLEASRALRGKRKRDGLIPLLETLTEKALKKALRVYLEFQNGSGPGRKSVSSLRDGEDGQDD